MFTFTFVLYCLTVLALGILAARRNQPTTVDAHLAGRDQSHWTAALSAGASTESGFVMLGMVGMGYSVGANCFWIIPAGILGYLINWVILAPAIRSKSESLEALTIPDLFRRVSGNQYGSRVSALLAASISIVFLLVYTSAQLNAAGKALSSEFEISYVTALSIAAALILSYAILGGFRAISWTDNLQAVMMMVSLVIIPLLAIFSLGGLSNLIDSLRSIDPALISLTAGAENFSGALMASLPWLMLGLAYPGQPHAVARLMATRTGSNTRIAATTGIVWFVLVYAGAITLGMAVRAGYAPTIGTDDTELLLPKIASTMVPGIIGGVVLASIVAAISSTADSTLFATASITARGFLSEQENRRVLFNIILSMACVIAFVFALFEVRAVFKLVLYAWAGLGASIGPAVIYTACCNSPKALALNIGMLVGAVLAFTLHEHSLNLLISFAASSVMIAVCHFGIVKLSPKKPANEH